MEHLNLNNLVELLNSEDFSQCSFGESIFNNLKEVNQLQILDLLWIIYRFDGYIIKYVYNQPNS